jgi:hypothetical protein
MEELRYCYGSIKSGHVCTFGFHLDDPLFFCLAWPRPSMVGGAFMAVAALLKGLGRAMAGRGTDVHHVLDQTLDRLVVTQFSFEALAKRVNYASASVSPVRCILRVPEAPPSLKKIKKNQSCSSHMAHELADEA